VWVFACVRACMPRCVCDLHDGGREVLGGDRNSEREPGSECALGCTRRLSISISIVGLNCEDVCRQGAGVGRIE